MFLASSFIFLLGLIVGSFLNVVIYRYGTGGWWRGGARTGQRSKCFSCGKVLHWYELIPLLSFVIQWGRCRGCKSKIAWQYPVVELLTGVAFWAVWQLFLSLPLLIPIYWAIISLLIVILVYDLRHKIIPDGPVFAFIGLSFLAPLIPNPRSLVPNLLAGLVLFIFFWALWYFSRGRWMGFGDVKLALGVGLLLGIGPGITAIVLAFWSGAFVGVALILFGKLARWRSARAGRHGLTMKSEIPFAPFIIFGAAVALFCQLNLINLIS